MLAASGVHPKVAQSIMRHSDINLTMSRYSHVLRGQESEAIERLPNLSLPSRQSQRARATGTDGSEERTLKRTPLLTPTADSERNSLSVFGNRQAEVQENRGEHNHREYGKLGTDSHRLTAVGMGEKEMGRGGFEPPTHGFSVRCSTN